MSLIPLRRLSKTDMAADGHTVHTLVNVSNNVKVLAKVSLLVSRY